VGYWENTTYVEADTARVATALEEQLAAEGMRRIERPAKRAAPKSSPMQYEGALANDLWGIAVFPGAPGWSVVKTAPLELLGERARGQKAMRFLELSLHLGAAGLQYHVYDSVGRVLVEADGRGGLALSGFGDVNGDDPFTFHDEALRQDRDIAFELLPFQKIIDRQTRTVRANPFKPHEGGTRRSIDADGVAAALAKTYGGANARFCDNMTSVHTLIAHEPLSMSGGVDLYFKRG
jgi:hypothetical protein